MLTTTIQVRKGLYVVAVVAYSKEARRSGTWDGERRAGLMTTKLNPIIWPLGTTGARRTGKTWRKQKERLLKSLNLNPGLQKGHCQPLISSAAWARKHQ